MKKLCGGLVVGFGREVDFLKIFTIKADKNNWNSIEFDGWESNVHQTNESTSLFNF